VTVFGIGLAAGLYAAKMAEMQARLEQTRGVTSEVFEDLARRYGFRWTIEQDAFCKGTVLRIRFGNGDKYSTILYDDVEIMDARYPNQLIRSRLEGAAKVICANYAKEPLLS
jgi:hypothetical protein